MSAVYFDERAFADKVMARVADEPTPTVSAAAGIAARQLNVRMLLDVGWTAWHLATARTAVVRPPLRIKSAALLSVMLLMLAMGTTLAAAGAVAVVQQVTHNFELPSVTGPHRPAATDPTAHAGGPGPGTSEDPDDAIHEHPGQSVQPSLEPVTSVTDPTNPGATPTDDGTRDGDDGNGNGQGDDPSPKPTASPTDNGGGKGAHPSPSPTPTATDDGHGADNGGGNNNDGGADNGGGKGTHASPSPSTANNGPGGDNGSGENVGGGDDNGSGNPDNGNESTDKRGNPNSGDGRSSSEDDNSQ